MARSILVGVSASLALLTAAPVSAQQLVRGQVVDGAGNPLARTHVRVSPVGQYGPMSTGELVVTGDDGRFEIPAPGRRGEYLYIGLGRYGYNILAGLIDPSRGTDFGALPLRELSPIDNVSWRWTPPYVDKADASDLGCNFCHGVQYTDWKDSLMAKSASSENLWVMSLYGAPWTSGAGPSYRRENPTKAGPCANCHAAAAALDAPSETVLHEVTGTAQNGVFCAVCHQVRDIADPKKPGVDGSLVIYRPSAWDAPLFAFGPYDDANSNPMVTAYNPLISTPRFCSGCHEWTNDFGVPVLSTFSEWSEVAGADPDALRCQDCHMKKKFGAEYQGDPPDELGFLVDDEHWMSHSGVLRSKNSMHPHVFRGGMEYAPEAAMVQIDAVQEGGSMIVTATVSNINAGHALPTGMPFRHAILVIEALAGSQPMTLTDGSVVPDYGGMGGSDQDLGGKPGKGYAKVLGDGTGARNVLFWKATEIIEDTRIGSGESERLTFRFAVPPAGGDAVVRARFIYRRAFIDLARSKGWDVVDVMMDEDEATLALSAPPAQMTPPPQTEQPAPASEDCSCAAAGSRARSGAPYAALLLLGASMLARRRRRS